MKSKQPEKPAAVAPVVGEVRRDQDGPLVLKLIPCVPGVRPYVYVARPARLHSPFRMYLRDWLALPVEGEGK